MSILDIALVSLILAVAHIEVSASLGTKAEHESSVATARMFSMTHRLWGEVEGHCKFKA